MSIILYQHVNFGGAHKHIIDRDEPNLHVDGWGDRVSSLDVIAGTWELWQHVNYGGNRYVLGPGSYSSLAAVGIPNDSISSVRRAGALAGLTVTPGVMLFEHADFRGAHRHIVDHDEPNLHSDGWGDRASSIIVVSGRWRICQHTNYGGWSVVLEPGMYPRIWNGGIGNDSASSVRRENPGWAIDPMDTRECVLYQHVDYQGDHRHCINRGERTLHADGWGDRVSSVQVVSGANWTFHEHINYQGQQIRLGPGSYPRIWQQGLPNDRLSSVRANVIPVAVLEEEGAATNINRDFTDGNRVYNQYNIEMVRMSTVPFVAPALRDLDQPTCFAGQVATAEEDALYNIGRDRFRADVVGYYVRSTNLGVRGCAAFPANRPGVVVCDGATRWTLAHELGHVLGLAHRNNTNELMNNGTAAIVANPPTLNAADQATVTASQFLV